MILAKNYPFAPGKVSPVVKVATGLHLRQVRCRQLQTSYTDKYLLFASGKVSPL